MPFRRTSLPGISRRSSIKPRVFASYALLCVILLCTIEATFELISLAQPYNRKDDQAETITHSVPFWRLTSRLPWTKSASEAFDQYTDIGASVSQSTPNQKAIIGKCTSIYGKYDHGYDKALATHIAHNELHRYPGYVLRRSIIDGLWSKEAALLAVLLQELAKPDEERLQWLAWFDADTIILNRLVPLETFLPPSEATDVHALVTEDWNGLNDGVFYLRISSWSVEMLSAVLAYRTFRPDEKLPFTEQSAMEAVIREAHFSKGVVFVPPLWFNAYPDDGGNDAVSYKVREGDMALHFAGVGGRDAAMQKWLYDLESKRDVWEVSLARTNLTKDAEWIWEGVRGQREAY